MASISKVTYTLDDETVATIRALARRRNKPQSLVVREAVATYAAQEEKLNEPERARRLKIVDDLLAASPSRPHVEVEHELREIRRARRVGYRRAGE